MPKNRKKIASSLAKWVVIYLVFFGNKIILFAHHKSIIQDRFKFRWQEVLEDGAPRNHHRIRAHIETIFRPKRIIFSLDKACHIRIVMKGICSDGKGQHLCALFSGGLSNILINSAVISFFLCVLDKFKDLITQISTIFDNLRERVIRKVTLSSPCLCLWAFFQPPYPPFSAKSAK